MMTAIAALWASPRARTASVAGAIFIVLLATLIAGLWQRGNHYRNGRDQWRNTANAQVDAVRNASAAAALRAEAARVETERRSAAHARKADHEEPPAVADLRRDAARYADDNADDNAADRYAAANRLQRPAKADPGLSGSAATTATHGPATDRDRPGDHSLANGGTNGETGEAVLVPRQRYDEFVGNTLRLVRVRTWGKGLVADGLAVTEGSEAPP